MAKTKEKSAPSRLFHVRSRIDIMARILNEAIVGAGKTRIMYRSNLNYRQSQTYLKLLLEMGMLKLISKKGSNTYGFFKTSAKGLEFLDAYRKLKALMTQRPSRPQLSEASPS